MMLKTQLVAWISALMLAGSVFATPQITCPDINVIKAEGLTMTEEIGPNIFLAYNISNYYTPDTYGFVMAPLQNNSSQEALENANDILNSMSAPGIPDQFNGTIICIYDTGHQDILAVLIKEDSLMSTRKLKHYFLKK